MGKFDRKFAPLSGIVSHGAGPLDKLNTGGQDPMNHGPADLM